MRVPPQDNNNNNNDDSGRASVSDVRKKWESRASTGGIGTKFTKFGAGVANTVVGGTKTVVGGTIGATKTVAKGTIGATKTVVGGTIGATKTVVGGTIGATKTVAKGTFGATKTVVGGTIGATKTVGKSARQAIQDVSLFASPRQVESKLTVGKPTKKIPIPSVFDKKPSSDQPKPEVRKLPGKLPIRPSVTEEKPATAVTDDKPKPGKLPVNKLPVSNASAAATNDDKPKAPAVPRSMTISEKARAYEAAMQERAKKFDIAPNAPGAAPFRMHGKRTSTLDKFTPMTQRHVTHPNNLPKVPFKTQDNSAVPTPKPQEMEQQPAPKEEEEVKKPAVEEDTLSPTSVGSLASESPEEETTTAAAPPTEVSDDYKDKPSELSPEAEEEAPAPKKKDGKGAHSKIDRNAIILQELEEIIRVAEETEIYDQIDDETVEILKEAALKSKAYTLRWYDAYSDSFIHCPSLAQTIVDYTLLELAEDKFQELYEEEFPMLYTVGLRGVACNVVAEEEEVPDYIYDLAQDGGPELEPVPQE